MGSPSPVPTGPRAADGTAHPPPDGYDSGGGVLAAVTGRQGTTVQRGTVEEIDSDRVTVKSDTTGAAALDKGYTVGPAGSPW